MGITSDAIEDIWPLTNTRIDKILQESGERKVYKISAQEGEYIVKVADSAKTKKKIETDTFAFDFLKQNGFNYIPSLIKTRGNNNFHQIDNRYVYIMEYVHGSNMPSTTENWKRLGKITAKLHQLSNYPYKTEFTVESEMPEFSESAKKLPFAVQYLEVVATLPSFNDLPECLIHTDIGRNNAMLRENDNEIIIIDWDDVGVGVRILDLGFPLICHFVNLDLTFEKEKAQSFYSGYLSLQKLTDDEEKHLFHAGLFYALMYLVYGDIEKNWKKIQFVLKNKSLIESAFTQNRF